MSALPEQHLFVLWEKARRKERLILNDIRKHLEVVAVRELRFNGSAAVGYRSFLWALFARCSKKDPSVWTRGFPPGRGS